MSPRLPSRLLRIGVAPLVGLTVATGVAAGHVTYVTEGTRNGDALTFLLEVLSDPLNAALLVGGGFSVVVAAIVYFRVQPARRDVAVFRETMTDYRDLLPWLLRLSFGLPLVGAGFAGYLFSPTVPPFLPVVVAPSRLFQITIGFMLLFGLATRVVAVIGLVVYLLGLVTRPELVLANEYVAGLLALVLIGSGRPSADHVLQQLASAEGTIYGEFDPIHRLSVWFNRVVQPYEVYLPTLVRVGLGLNFVFLGVVEKLLSPNLAVAVVEKYNLTAVIPVDAGLWVVGAGLTEVALGIALILGVFTRASSLLGLTMFTLTLFGLPDDPVLAHITLFGLASFLLVTGSGPFAVDGWIRGRVDTGRGASHASLADDREPADA